uniref:ABC-type xenobiotic transporter n=1 Tax=Syphacia muris TaxID=451379 RepID=A0A0N5AI25_9BILA
MYAVGSIVAIATGCGMPLMSIIIGDISQSLVNAQALHNIMHSTESNNTVTLNYTMDDFHDDIITCCLKYVYLGCGMFVAAALQVLTYLVACENMNDRLRRKFFLAVLRQDIAWYDENQSGTLTTKLFDNLERIKEGTGDKVALLVQCVSQFFAGYVVAFTYDWKLTLIMMSLSPFMIICGAFLAKLMASATSSEVANYAEAGAIAEEVLTSVRTVVSFNAQETECKRYDGALHKSMKDGIIKSFYIGVGVGMTFLIIFSSYTLAFWVGTSFVCDGTIGTNTLLTVFFGVMMGSMALGNAGSQFAVVGVALGAAQTMLDLIERKPAIDASDEGGDRPADLKGKVEFQNVDFSYPTRPDIQILKNISFTANPGETIALVGSSGCGKSTSVGLLLRYYDVDSGKVIVDGHDIKSLNIGYLRNMIGVVSQEPVLFNTTIEDNIAMGREDITLNEIISACRHSNAHNFINTLPEKYQTLVGDRGTQLSGGQKQRIAIARALVRNPKILLLDEATSALDAESESIVQEALEKATYFLQIIETGKHEELLAQKGFYHELVNAQVFTDIGDDKSKQNEETVSPTEELRQRLSSVTSTYSRCSSKLSDKRNSIVARFNNDTSEAAARRSSESKAQKERERLKKELYEEGATESNLFAILQYAKPEWLYILLGLLGAMVKGCVFPAFSLFFTEIINVFASTDNDYKRSKGHFWALMFLLLGGIQFVCMFAQAFFMGLASEKLCRRLRAMLFRNIMRMHIGYFDMPQHSSGKISTRLATDTSNVKTAIDFRLGNILSAAFSVGCGLVIAFYYSWQLALLVVAIFPLVGVGQALQLRYIQGRHHKDSKDLENSGKVALEAIENIRTVHALTLQKRFYRQFCHYLDGPHQTSTRKAIIQGLCYGFSNSIFYFITACAYRFGLFLVQQLYSQLQCPPAVLDLPVLTFRNMQKAKLAAGIIFKMLKENTKIDGLSESGEKPYIHGEVDFNNLHFAYPERPTIQILKGLTLQVGVGQTLAIVGPSGCGKSTVVSLLERFYDPEKGSVEVDKKDIRSMNIQHHRAQIAMVSQEPILFDCSIKENIVYGLPKDSVTDEQIEKVAREANIHSFIADLPLGYDTRVGERGTQLSGGQKQRIAIARALIRNPKILLLDEATSALDTESEAIVQEALDRASEGRTCIIIAHRLSTIVNADCIAVVKNGVVLEKGNVLPEFL